MNKIFKKNLESRCGESIEYMKEQGQKGIFNKNKIKKKKCENTREGQTTNITNKERKGETTRVASISKYVLIWGKEKGIAICGICIIPQIYEGKEGTNFLNLILY